MSSAEQQSVSDITVDIDNNPYLAEGAGTVDAIAGSALVAYARSSNVR